MFQSLWLLQLYYFAPQMALQQHVNHSLSSSFHVITCVMQLFLPEQAFDGLTSRFTYLVYEKSFIRFVQHATLTTVGKFSTDKNSIAGSRIIRPLSRAFKNILSPCSKAYLNVILDHKFSGIFRAVRSADKLIKAHCFPLECN